MGWGALIGSLVSTGVSLAGSLTKKGPGASLAEESSRINENAKRFITPFALGGSLGQDYWNLNIPQLAEQGLQFGYAFGPTADVYNMGQLQSLLNQALPGYQGMIGQMQKNVGQLQQGQVPGDVQDQIRRNAAYQSLIGGTAGAGTGTAGAITARDLGLTSLGLQQTGYQEGTGLLQLARNYLMPQPVNPLSLLPLSDLIQGEEWTKEAFFKANEAAFSARVAAAEAQAGTPPSNPLAGIGGEISGLFGALSQQQGSSGQTGFDLIRSLFGGGGGGGITGGGDTSGGGFNIDLSNLAQGTSFGY